MWTKTGEESFPLHASAFLWEYSDWRRSVKSSSLPSYSLPVTITNMRYSSYNWQVIFTQLQYRARWHMKIQTSAVSETQISNELTNSMAQSPSEGSSFLSTQEIPRMLWNTKFHYPVHKIPSVTQINPVYGPSTPILLQFCSNHLARGIRGRGSALVIVDIILFNVSVCS